MNSISIQTKKTGRNPSKNIRENQLNRITIMNRVETKTTLVENTIKLIKSRSMMVFFPFSVENQPMENIQITLIQCSKSDTKNRF